MRGQRGRQTCNITSGRSMGEEHSFTHIFSWKKKPVHFKIILLTMIRISFESLIILNSVHFYFLRNNKLLRSHFQSYRPSL